MRALGAAGAPEHQPAHHHVYISTTICRRIAGELIPHSGRALLCAAAAAADTHIMDEPARALDRALHQRALVDVYNIILGAYRFR